jgi:hypothetical protein
LNHLDRKIRDLDNRIHHVHFNGENQREKEIDPLTKAELEMDQPLLDHLLDKHVGPISKWKLDVGLERKHTDQSALGYFVNYGVDFQNPTIEEYEFFRLDKKRDEAMGYNPRKDSNYKFGVDLTKEEWEALERKMETNPHADRRQNESYSS